MPINIYKEKSRGLKHLKIEKNAKTNLEKNNNPYINEKNILKQINVYKKEHHT